MQKFVTIKIVASSKKRNVFRVNIAKIIIRFGVWLGGFSGIDYEVKI